jgi:ABC-type transport system substrate-binding protein
MRTKKRLFLVLSLLVATLLIVQCGGAATPAPAKTTPASEELTSATSAPTEAATAAASAGLGTIKVGTEAAFPPFESKDANGNIVGFDIDLMTAIGKEAGFTPQFIDTPFDGIFVAVQSGQFDAVISAATITQERAQVVDFSDPYFDAGLAVAVREGAPYKTPDDLQGKKIGVQLGTTGDKTATEKYGEANVRRYDDALLAFQALIAGDVEAVVNDLPVTQAYIASNPNAKIVLMSGMLTSEQYGIAVSKKRPELLAAINKGLAAVKANGTYDALYKKWIIAAQPAAAETPAATPEAAASGTPQAAVAPCQGASNLKSIEAVDDYTVKLTLCNPDPAIPYKMAFNAMAFQSPANLEKYGGGGDLVSHPVGTGPYMLSEWVRDDHIKLVANPDYWGTKAKTPNLIMRPITESAARFLELQAGTVDIINNLGPDDFATAKADPNVQVLDRPAFNVGYLWFNRDMKPFDNESVRQAVGMCLDREALVKAFYPPSSQVADQFMPPGLFGFTQGMTWYPRDTAKAKQMLADAGYPNGLDVTLSLRDTARAYFPEPAKIAEAIQAQLKECNVNAKLNVVESGTFLDEAAAGKYEMGMLGWLGDYADPTNWLDFHFMGTGAGKQFGEPFPDIVALLQDAGRTADQAKRQADYDKVNELIKQHVPMVPIAYGGSAMAASKAIEGLVASPLNSEVYSLVSKQGADTIVYAKAGEASSLDCSDETDGESFEVCNQITEGLLGFKPGTTEVIPVLAEKYESNDDATVWTFHLRQGVKFTDGTPFNAQAVVTNIERQWDPQNPLHKGRTGEFYYFVTFFGGFKGQ